MATKDKTNTSELPIFSKLKDFEKLAIELRNEGRSADEIVATLNADYQLAYKRQTIYEWFMAGGRLEQAYYEYCEAQADYMLKLARLKLKKGADQAADTLVTLQGEGFESTVRLGAAKAVLNKFIPDKQLVIGEDTDPDDLPDELVTEGDDIAAGGEDEQPSSPGESGGELPAALNPDDAPAGKPADPKTGK